MLFEREHLVVYAYARAKTDMTGQRNEQTNPPNESDLVVTAYRCKQGTCECLSCCFFLHLKTLQDKSMECMQDLMLCPFLN